MVALEDGAAQSPRSPVVATGRRSIVRMLGLVAVLLAAPVVVVVLAAGHFPVTGLVVSFVLLFAVVWLLVPPSADRV